MRDWHRIFGMSVAVTVTGRPFRVVQELELSQMRQRLDLAVIRTTETGSRDWPDLPDGFTDLAEHNVITYKSIRESLTTGSMLELLSHVVAYAKQQWRDEWENNVCSRERVLAIAVATPHPAWLRPDHDPGLKTVVSGVYEVPYLQMAVRVIVPRQAPRSPRNALWHLLSGDAELVAYGLEHCDVQDPMLYNILNDLRETYSLEGVEMPYTLEDYRREVMRENWAEMSPEERSALLKDMPSEERLQLLKDTSLQERSALLRDMPPDERLQLLKDISLEERSVLLKDMPLEERLQGLSEEQIEAYLKALRGQSDSNGGNTKRSD